MSSPKKNTPQIKFLARMPEEQRARIFARAGELGRLLGEWLARYPQEFMSAERRKIRIPQASLTLAATTDPFLDAASLLPPARMMFWIFTVDDLFDDGEKPAAELVPRFSRCLALLDNPEDTDTAGDPLLEVMRDARDSLARYPLFATLRPHLVQSLRDMVECMRRESEWSAGHLATPRGSLPSPSEYFENGRHTTGSLPLYLSVFITMGDDSVVSHLPRLLEMNHQAAGSIRCANELRGSDREEREQKLNGISMVRLEYLTLKLKPEQARARARERLKVAISRRLERCQKLAVRESTTSGNPERFILNIAAFICNFYAHHDFHQPKSA